jgi:hypothetical protein
MSSATIDFPVGNTQNSRKNVSFNGEGAYSWEVLFGKITEYVTGWHFKKQIAAKFSGDRRGIMPVHTVRNIVREVVRDAFRSSHCARVYIADVGHLRRSQLQ